MTMVSPPFGVGVRVRARVFRLLGSSRFRCSVMEEPNWKEVVLQSLEQRDARELFSSDIYEACIRFRPPKLISRPETRDVVWNFTGRRASRTANAISRRKQEVPPPLVESLKHFIQSLLT